MNEKLQHLIPQTYLTPWLNGDNDTLLVSTKENLEENLEKILEKTLEISLETLFASPYYHPISVGMPFAIKEDTDTLFEPLSGLKVFYREKELTSTLEMNREFDYFDDWEIMREDGSHVKKKILKHEISQTKIDLVEEEWFDKYESTWEDTRKNLEKLLLNGENKKITLKEKHYLLGMFLTLNGKNLCEIPLFSELFTLVPHLKHVELPKRQATRSYIKTTDDELFQWLLLNLLRQFIAGYGAIYEISKELCEKVSVQFMVASENQRFITSDIPTFYANEIGYFPLSPKILLCITKKKQSELCDIVLTKDEDVCKYNKIIKNNSNHFIIQQKNKE